MIESFFSVFNAIEVPASETDLVIVFDGDSLTRSHHGSNIEQYYPLQVNEYLEGKFKSKEFYSYGVGGQTLQQMMADAATQIYSKPKAGKENILIAWEDANALGFSGNRTAQQNYDDFITYFQGAKAAGFQKCVLITTFYFRTVDGVLPNNQEVNEARRHEFFEMVKNTDLNTVPWDYHIDMREAPFIGGVAMQEIDYNYFFDSIHPNQTGYDTGVISMVINKLNEIYNL